VRITVILSASVVDAVVLSCVSLSGREEEGFEAPSENCEKRILSSSCLRFVSVCPHETFRLPLDGFSWNSILVYSLKTC